MPNIPFLLLLILLPAVSPVVDFSKIFTTQRSFAAEESLWKTSYRLTKPLIGDDGKIYSCSQRNFFAFESNGSIAWTIHLNYSCHTEIAPFRDNTGKIYIVAENRVLKIVPANIGSSKRGVEVFFGDASSIGVPDEIIGISFSLLSSCIFISVKNRGLFAYTLRGLFLWSAGPVLNRFGYRQGCKRNYSDCYFASAPVVDQCEGSIYISNTEGEVYSLSIRSPHFKWIQDFSAFDRQLKVTPGNNGLVYVTIPSRALLFALDVFTGSILWQNDIGQLSTTECSPVVDSNGWISIGSLDGYLYSFSPIGVLKKFPKARGLDSVIQVSPLLDCSGYAVYISQTKMEGKISQTTGDYTSVSALKPKNAVFALLVPATGAVQWTGDYYGRFLSFLAESDLHHFALDERILLAFITASKMGNPFACRTSSQKISSTCSQARIKRLSIYTGSERTILLFLLFQTLVLVVLAGLVRFCFIFWRKKKLQDQDLGKFLEKRRSLRVRKKEFDRTITELEHKAAEKAVDNEVLEQLGDLVREREGIERKLSTTYSLGSDRKGSFSRTLLPLYNENSRSYSFQSGKKESVTIFHTLSGSSSRERSTSDWSSNNSSCGNESSDGDAKESAVKGKGHADVAVDDEKKWGSPSGAASGSNGYMKSLFIEQAHEGDVTLLGSSRSISLKRRRPLSSTN